MSDNLDFEILKLLQEDGRMSFTNIASKLKIAVSTVRNRYVALIGNDTLKIIGRVNPEAIGFNAYTSVLISVKPKTLLHEVSEKLIDIPEVSFLAITSGEFDLELNVQCRDMNHLMELLKTKIHTIEGVFDTKTNMYLKVLKIAQPNLDLAKNQ